MRCSDTRQAQQLVLPTFDHLLPVLVNIVLKIIMMLRRRQLPTTVLLAALSLCVPRTARAAPWQPGWIFTTTPSNAIDVFDSSGAYQGRLSIPDCSVGLSPSFNVDNTALYVPCVFEHTIKRVPVAEPHAPITTIPVDVHGGQATSSVAFTSDGSAFFAGVRWGTGVSMYDTATGVELASYDIDPSPAFIVVDPSNQFIYYTTQLDSTVYRYDIIARAPMTPLATAVAPAGHELTTLSFGPPGTLLVLDYNDGKVRSVSLADGAVTTKWNGIGGGYGLDFAYNPDGRIYIATLSAHLFVVDEATGTVIVTTALPVQALGVAVLWATTMPACGSWPGFTVGPVNVSLVTTTTPQYFKTARNTQCATGPTSSAFYSIAPGTVKYMALAPFHIDPATTEAAACIRVTALDGNACNAAIYASDIPTNLFNPSNLAQNLVAVSKQACSTCFTANQDGTFSAKIMPAAGKYWQLVVFAGQPVRWSNAHMSVSLGPCPPAN